MKMGIKGIIISVVSVLAGATLIAFGGYLFLKNHYKKREVQKITTDSKQYVGVGVMQQLASVPPEYQQVKTVLCQDSEDTENSGEDEHDGVVPKNQNEDEESVSRKIIGENRLGGMLFSEEVDRKKYDLVCSILCRVKSVNIVNMLFGEPIAKEYESILSENSIDPNSLQGMTKVDIYIVVKAAVNLYSKRCVGTDAKAKVELMQTQIQQLEQDRESLGCVDEKSKETLEGIIKEMKDMALKNTFKPDDDWVQTLKSAYSLCYGEPDKKIFKQRIISIENELKEFRKATNGGKKRDDGAYDKISGMVSELKEMLNNNNFCPNKQWKNILCGAKNLLDTMDMRLLDEANKAAGIMSSK